MKTIKGEITEIILDEGDELLITMLQGNKQKIYISARNGALHIDDLPLSEVNQIQEEKRMIKNMKEYKKNREKWVISLF